jgi:predicted amidohydrolase
MPILSAVQFRPRLASCQADVLDNLRRCEPLIHRASSVGSQLVVFPELFLTGYSFMSREEAGRVCERQDGPTFRAMRAAAQDLKAYVAWGYVELGESGRLHNSAAMVDPDGSIVTRYRKVNLWGNDFLWATPGEVSAPIVRTELGRTSLVVCRDLRDKIPQNIPRTASSKKEPPLFLEQPVDLVAACVNWGKGGFPSTSWMDFAANNACTLVVANRWGEEMNGSFSQDFGHGGSAIVEKDWTVHTGGLTFGDDCVVTGIL